MDNQYKDQQDCGNISPKALFLANDNISLIMTDTEALADDSQMHILLGDLPWELKANVVMKLELDPRNPSMFTYATLQKLVFNNCFHTYDRTILDLDGARMVPRVHLYSVRAAIPFPQMLALVNLLAICREEIPTPR